MPYWQCGQMESVDPQTSIACCGLPDGSKCLVTARDGCLRFEREPGIDDDWNPEPPRCQPQVGVASQSSSAPSLPSREVLGQCRVRAPDLVL